MNKRPDDPNKHGAVVTLGEPQLPAVIKKTKNPWKKFSLLDRLADEIAEEYEVLVELESEILERKPGEEVHGDWKLVTDETRQKLERCDELIKELDGPENYDEADDDYDDDKPILKKSVISGRLAAMMAGVHIGGPKEDEQQVFVKILLSHVYDAQVSRLVLESACREIERTEKFMQATSEVLEVLNEQRDVWERRCNAINDIDRRSKDVQEFLLEAQQDYEREALEAKQKAELKEAKEAHFKAANKLQSRHQNWVGATEFAIVRQEAASKAHQAMVSAMNTLATRAMELEQARAELTIAFERIEQLDPPLERGDKLKKGKDA